VIVPPLTWLYVPGDRPDRVEKALASAAHAVIVDLEDAVGPSAKDEARANLAALLDRPRGKPVHVRINALATGLAGADLAVVSTLAGATGIHVPKVDGPADVRSILDLLPPREEPWRLHCLLESARGLESAFAIATAAPEVASISLGEADLGAETGATGAGLDWARSRVVNAAVAAGLPRPQQSVYANVKDLDGLARSCAHGRELGHLGRAAIHPAQLPVIEQAYLPTEAEAERARQILGGFQESTTGRFMLDGGDFVDVAIVRAAIVTAAIAERYGTR
jgi:citrate lyase subunit beta/citryl-CoA lyase